jgi:CopG family nickel-responsive transcriptional regulator
MQKITRFGVSIDEKLLEHFDEKISSEGYLNRSEAIRDLIRESLVEKEWKLGDGELIGVVSLVFSHSKRELTEALTEIQHHHYPSIISAVHIHLDRENCLEVLILKGKGKKIRSITDELKTLRGVKHCQLSISTTGKELP